MPDSHGSEMNWTDNLLSRYQLSRRTVLRDSDVCIWCRGTYRTAQERNAHKAETSPRYIEGEDRYVCDYIKSFDRHDDRSRNSSSGAPKPTHAVETPLLEDTQDVAQLEHPISAPEKKRRTSSLLAVYHFNEQHDVSGEGELSEDFTLDPLEMQEDRMEDDGEDLENGQPSDDDEAGIENDEVGDLPGHRDADAAISLFGTSMLVIGSFDSYSIRTSSMPPLTSPAKQSFSFASPRTFGTAKSSLASYATAPSYPTYYPNTRTSLRAPLGADRHHAAFADMVSDITTHVTSVKLNSLASQHEAKIRGLVQKALNPISPGGADDWQGLQLNIHTRALIQRLIIRLGSIDSKDSQSGTGMISDTGNESKRAALTSYVESRVSSYFELRRLIDGKRSSNTVFSSEWLAHLNTRGILPNPAEELDWSGKGQHVEYTPEEEANIPLVSEKILGHSQTAIIESVRCRRIRLARKKIACSRQLKKEDAISEVEHLRRLQHAHIVRVVGTYTLKRQLAILLYPAADCDLDTFLNDRIDSSMSVADERCGIETIETFFGCLSNATAFIHEHNVKHMDIKPKNILVRLRRVDFYTVYIADFGIARSYQSAGDSETDTPVPFTRTYAAPEVVLQDKRGFNADIFSLGCVFMEMMATIFSLRTKDAYDERNRLLEIRTGTSGHPAFYASISRVLQWYEDISRTPIALLNVSTTGDARFMDLCPRMLSEDPSSRPSSSELKESTAWISCHECNAGPEPFEAAT